MALTTANIPGMTVTQYTDAVRLSYRDRHFKVIIGQSGDDQPNWGAEVIEVLEGELAEWDNAEFDYATADRALWAAQDAIRQTVDDDADDRR